MGFGLRLRSRAGGRAVPVRGEALAAKGLDACEQLARCLGVLALRMLHDVHALGSGSCSVDQSYSTRQLRPPWVPQEAAP